MERLGPARPERPTPRSGRNLGRLRCAPYAAHFRAYFLAWAPLVHLGPRIGRFVSGLGRRATTGRRLWNRTGRPGAPDRNSGRPKRGPYSAQYGVDSAFICSPRPRGSIWAPKSGLLRAGWAPGNPRKPPIAIWGASSMNPILLRTETLWRRLCRPGPLGPFAP